MAIQTEGKTCLKRNCVVEAINERIAELEKVVSKAEKIKQMNLAGRLRVRKYKNTFQYFQINEKTDHNGEYIKRDNELLAQKLAYKSYFDDVGTLASREILQLKKLLDNYNPEAITNAYDNLHEGRKVLINPVEMSSKEYADAWQKIEYDRKPIDLNRVTFQTIKGESVRSKSEAIIADTLYAMGIPYHYEMPLHLAGYGTIHPDFTVLNIEKREVFYLEHLGMIDERGYLRDAVDRIDAYEKNGLYPGEKLLLTYETEKRPLKREELKTMLNHYLLCR